MTDSVLPSKVPVVSASDDSEGMSYLESLPRRVVTLYLPLAVILIVLLFPFYWMALTSIKPDEQLIDMNTYNPFWVVHPTFKHISKLLFETQYPRWLWNTMYVAVGATTLSIIASVLAAYAIVRLRFKGADTVGVLDLFCLSGATLDPVHSAGVRDPGLRPFRFPAVADPGLPHAAHSVLDLAVDGILQDHSL